MYDEVWNLPGLYIVKENNFADTELSFLIKIIWIEKQVSSSISLWFSVGIIEHIAIAFFLYICSGLLRKQTKVVDCVLNSCFVLS